MSKAAKKEYRRKVADRLRKYGKALNSKGIIGNTTPFENAAKECENEALPVVKGIKIDYSNSWGYTLSNLVFNIPDGKKANRGNLPEGSSIVNISVSCMIIGKYTRNDYAEDPFNYLEFNIVIKGKNKDGESMSASWHLDKHLENEDDNDPTDIHPTYHFQYGGKKLKIPNNNYGNHIILDTPRLMHLPLDAILGVDFVLANFLGQERKLLSTQVKDYVDCINELQDIIWRPYVLSIAQKWDSYANDRVQWERKKICPQLL